MFTLCYYVLRDKQDKVLMFKEYIIYRSEAINLITYYSKCV